MKTYRYEQVHDQMDELLERTLDPGEKVGESVREIISRVRNEKDKALKAYTEAFDHVALDSVRVSEEEIEEAMQKVDPKLLSVFEQAADQIRTFHETQKEESYLVSPREGVKLGQKITPIASCGIYIPGGKAAYPSTVLMNAIPAKVAGVGRIAMVTPPGPDGKIGANILACAKLAGVNEIYKVGGAQAVAALAYGTESIAPVDKITGPGNIFVATAKREVFGRVDIDMIAGPSEVLIIADENARPDWVAADLLAQAEHDEMAMPILVTTSEKLAKDVEAAIDHQIEQDLNRKEIARKSVTDYGFIFLCEDLEQACELANQVAPEHLELNVADPDAIFDKIINAGAIFLGAYTPEPVGDYFAGPNHTLPTSGTARFSSPLGVYDFVKRSSILRYDQKALLKEADQIADFALCEGLDAHARSVLKRKEN